MFSIRTLPLGTFIATLFCLTFGTVTAAPLDGETKRIVEKLQGRWQGSGNVYWLDGHVDPFICKVTHFVSAGATKVKQTARCAGTGQSYAQSAHDMLPTFRLDWTISGTAITGTWSEEKYGLSGIFRGKVLANGFQFEAEHEKGSGKVRVTMSDCQMDAIAIPSQLIKDAKIHLKKDGC